MSGHGHQPQPIAIAARDGYRLQGLRWQHASSDQPARPVVVINPATSVQSRYYARFAAFLFAHGFDVVTYDYRGIGGSRPRTLRGFDASWIDWGTQDFEGVLRFVAAGFPGQPVQVVAHSVGGFLIGLAESNHLISRVFTMGAQFAHWRDYARERRLSLLWKWHVVMPALAALLGYFPGKRLGWMEDTPRGVVHDWTARHPRFEDAYRSGRRAMTAHERQGLVDRFAEMRGAILALSVTDDEFGTVPAIERLLGYFTRSETTHLRIAPAMLGLETIGHFAFFNNRFEHTLWQIPLGWLQHGQVPGNAPGDVVPPAAAVSAASAMIQSITS
jgi:predicted alpha/beta hydrolase